MDLFEAARAQDQTGVPLAERMRPRKLDEVVGQPHLVGEHGLLAKCLARGRIPSMIFWGPPGTGKTTLAEIVAEGMKAHCISMSAVMAGIKDIRSAVSDAKRARDERGTQTILFIDEIHRFNKSQQDALLPHVEKGIVTLIGATTENPSFEVNAALISRCRVLVTRPIDERAMEVLIQRALTKLHGGSEDGGVACRVSIDEHAQLALLKSSGGDARKLLSTLEIASEVSQAESLSGEPTGPQLSGSNASQEVCSGEMRSIKIDKKHVEQAVSRRVVLFDKRGDAHYGVVSAFIKSMRGCDPHATCHYLARMLEAGEDPRFILRRMVIFASEDVGNADPVALQVATSALHAFELVGLPEGTLPLTQAATYLACAPKSNAVLKAYSAARKDVMDQPDLSLPKHLLNAPTQLMKNLGYGQDYRYPHDFDGNFVPENYLPDGLKGKQYYIPSNNGCEVEIARRLKSWNRMRQKK